MRCIKSMKIIDILRLTDLGYGQRDIGLSLGHGKSTVGDVQRRCREAGLSYQLAKCMTEQELQEKLYPASSQKRNKKSDPDFEYIHKELKSNPKLNLKFLWEEYKQNSPLGLEYSQFCNRYKEWQGGSFDNLTMVIDREPGKEMFVDWMGKLYYGVVTPETGEIIEAHLYVSTLGVSHMPYVEAFPDEKLDKWLLANRHALEYYGGTPKIIVPDNCKTAIHKPNRYDPVINPSYQEFAAHYNVAVIPARVRKPKDKASVEGSVGWMEVWLLGKLRNQTFFSFAELNQTIRKYLAELTYREFQKRPGSRYSVFKELDEPNLQPLPKEPYECYETVIRTVPDNYHVEFDKFYYSVPFALFKHQVTVKATTTTVEIFDNRTRQRVTTHIRRRSGMRYVTDPDHMPENHRHHWEFRQYDAERYLKWALSIGPGTSDVINNLLTAADVKEQSYRSCMGILQLSKKYGPDRLENACIRAKAIHAMTYSVIANILKTGQDLAQVPSTVAKPTPPHENIRGPGYYQ